MDSKRLFLVTLFLLTGCANNLPVEISTPVEGSPQLAEVLQDLDAYKGKIVRWGGSIASVENKKDETWVELVSRELSRNGRPKDNDRSEGRFLAKVSKFLDPEIYKKGRLVTVYGELAGGQEGVIGEKPYIFLVVKTKKILMWTEYRDPPPTPYYHRYYDPYWGTYWDPYWGLYSRRHFFHRDPRYWY